MTVDDAYRDIRQGHRAERDAVWRHIIAHLGPWIDPTVPVLDLGTGTGAFIAAVEAVRRIAVDADPHAVGLGLAGVEAHVLPATNLSAIADASIGTIMASNLLEHLERDDAARCIDECRRVLRPGGHLILVQPNFRLRPREYFDDYTHRTIFTDVSLADLVTSRGLDVVRADPRFLPLTMKSRLRVGHRLVPLYLRSPWRPLAGQMLVIGRRPAQG